MCEVSMITKQVFVYNNNVEDNDWQTVSVCF